LYVSDPTRPPSFVNSIVHGQVEGLTALGPEVSTVDPRFVDPLPGDYRLRPDSPAVDRAAPAEAPATDLLGNARPCGVAPDIGAHEMCDALPELPHFARQRRHARSRATRTPTAR
jgi:hypothetical protein